METNFSTGDINSSRRLFIEFNVVVRLAVSVRACLAGGELSSCSLAIEWQVTRERSQLISGGDRIALNEPGQLTDNRGRCVCEGSTNAQAGRSHVSGNILPPL